MKLEEFLRVWTGGKVSWIQDILELRGVYVNTGHRGGPVEDQLVSDPDFEVVCGDSVLIDARCVANSLDEDPMEYFSQKLKHEELDIA